MIEAVLLSIRTSWLSVQSFQVALQRAALAQSVATMDSSVLLCSDFGSDAADDSKVGGVSK